MFVLSVPSKTQFVRINSLCMAAPAPKTRFPPKRQFSSAIEARSEERPRVPLIAPRALFFRSQSSRLAAAA
jgi:hypothetical protein